MARQFAATVQGLLGLLVGVTSLSLPALNGDLRVASTPANRTTLDAIKPPIINHCFRPGTHHLIRPTNLADCKEALRILVQQPGLKNRYRFSRNPRRGLELPQSWDFRDCAILLSCGNDHDADTFSYADVLRKAKFIVDRVQGADFDRLKCVKVTEGELAWGGVNNIGTEGTFYVSVNGRQNADDTGLLQLANITTEAIPV